MSHIHEKLDFTVEVFVVHKNKVLLRKHDKYGIWLSVGGHIEKHEDPTETALREVKEEVGLDIKLYDTRTYLGNKKIKTLVPPIALIKHDISETHEHVAFIYFASADTYNVVPESDLDEWRWCSEDDIKNMTELQEDVRVYSLMALSTLSK